ncbi:MAG TPA: translocation/assembly module TamB domain-containing protein, partial [Nannocystaceae bacterium]|nr:translocation/assembly module TamB domain-containing protein [Nannocystaceae bacterium]
LPVMKLSSRVDVELDARGPTTDIDIVARKSTLDVFTSTVPAPKKLPEADGVVYTDARSKRERAEKRSTGKEPMVPSDVKVAFRLGDPIFIRGPQANMTWRGGIELEHRGPGQITAKGALTADSGRINLLGNDFEIEHGRVTMPERGEVDPYIDLVATTELPEASVDVIVRGRASRPELRFASDPPMPESDVFALLVTGSTNEQGGEGDAVGTKAASLLAAFQNPVLQRELQDSLGIDRVGVGFGENIDQPIVTVGKRVSKRVYVETRYHHNAPRDENNAELQLEYAVKPPAWSIETFFGDAAKGGLGVWWRRRFGGKRAPTPATPAAPLAGDAASQR